MLDVTLIAHSCITTEPFELLPYASARYNEWPEDAEYLAEFAGRACYQSWNRPNPETADTQDYVRKNILAKGHESVLEHASATFYITGVSRSLTHELIRHRHLSVSELSQRYVDMRDTEYAQPPAVLNAEIAYAEAEGANWDEAKGHTLFQTSEFFDDVAQAYSDLVDILDENTYLSRKRVREAARFCMPNATETKIVVTGNMRAWRHVLMLRGSEHADAEIRELAVALFRELREIAPSIFSDMDIVILEDGRQTVQAVKSDRTYAIADKTAGELGLTG